MKKPPKKPHYIKKPLEPEWEDEELIEQPINPKIKQEEEAKLFKEALENDSFQAKESEAERTERFANNKRSQKKNARQKTNAVNLNRKLIL